jgi:hypothetical protein
VFLEGEKAKDCKSADQDEIQDYRSHLKPATLSAR